VAGGANIVPGINAAMAQADCVVLTQDWHPANHLSFASQHAGRAAFDVVEMAYGPQVLWPDHCVQGSHGAGFHPGLNVAAAHLILRKGHRRAIDSYSAFFENDKTTSTGLFGYLQQLGITQITLAGLATDFCVAYSACDAARLGLGVRLRTDLCRAIDLDGSLQRAQAEMAALGAQLVSH